MLRGSAIDRWREREPTSGTKLAASSFSKSTTSLAELEPSKLKASLQRMQCVVCMMVEDCCCSDKNPKTVNGKLLVEEFPGCSQMRKEHGLKLAFCSTKVSYDHISPFVDRKFIRSCIEESSMPKLATVRMLLSL